MPKKYFATLEKDGYTEVLRPFSELPLLDYSKSVQENAPGGLSWGSYGPGDYEVTVCVTPSSEGKPVFHVFQIPPEVAAFVDQFAVSKTQEFRDDLRQDVERVFERLGLIVDRD
jgi:hypothetical protein